MNNKIIGLILIIVGVALVAWGYNVYQSVGAEFSRVLSGNTPMKAWAGMVGGAVCIVIGIFRVK